eukprot:7376409-Prymnesium_polylepis.4
MKGGIGGGAGTVGRAGGDGDNLHPGTLTPARMHIMGQSAEISESGLPEGGLNTKGQPAADAAAPYSARLIWHTAMSPPPRAEPVSIPI